MKTYNERMEAILKKARKQKILRICLKSVTSVLCFAAIIAGLLYIPYGSPMMGVNPTDPSTNITQPPTVDTIPTNPTLPTVPTTKPTDPIVNQYEDFTFADLYMGWAKVKHIEELWAEKDFFGDSEAVFSD